jgi:hypothetical protein
LKDKAHCPDAEGWSTACHSGWSIESPINQNIPRLSRGIYEAYQIEYCLIFPEPEGPRLRQNPRVYRKTYSADGLRPRLSHGYTLRAFIELTSITAHAYSFLRPHNPVHPTLITKVRSTARP